jgi:DNA-binding NarL/FixJ family response regulator
VASPIEPPKSGLTARQWEVLERLRQGESNKLIGRQLKLRESTVKVHIRQIMRKLGASNRTQAALCAAELDVSARDKGELGEGDSAK